MFKMMSRGVPTFSTIEYLHPITRKFLEFGGNLIKFIEFGGNLIKFLEF